MAPEPPRGARRCPAVRWMGTPRPAAGKEGLSGSAWWHGGVEETDLLLVTVGRINVVVIIVLCSL